jgi:NAD(P)H-dependent FMN reductase
MSNLNIGIIISSTREARVGREVAEYIYGIASKRDDLNFEIIDLRDYSLPRFNEGTPNDEGSNVNDPVGRKWKDKIKSLDGYIFAVAEYNGGMTGVLKNALDYTFVEWMRKPAAYFGYGSLGGARAVQDLRLICTELHMAPLRNAVYLQGVDFFSVMSGNKKIEEFSYLEPLTNDMLNHLAWWAKSLKEGRKNEVA